MFMGVTPKEREADRLSSRLVELAGVINVAMAEMVDVVAEADAVEAWAGYRSIEQWLLLHTGTSSPRAAKLVRMARQLRERPVLHEAFGAGEVSEDQVAAVARVPVHNEAEVTDLARVASVPQLQRIMSSYTWPDPVDPVARAEADDQRRRVSFGYDDDGWWRINGRLPGQEGAVFEQAMQVCRDRLHCDAEVPEVTWADAAVAMADACVAAKGKGRSNRDRYLSFLHIETSVDGHGHGRVHAGPALPDTARRYLTCDGHIRPLLEIGGTPVNVGRTQRIVPDRLRWVIEDRDRGCRTPGCAIGRVEVHHLTHWEDGGTTDTHNLIALCPAHHKLHHQGLLHIHGNPDRPDGLEFTMANGRRLRLSPPTPLRHPIDQAVDHLGLPAPNWNHPTGEPYDGRFIWFRAPPEPATAADD